MKNTKDTLTVENVKDQWNIGFGTQVAPGDAQGAPKWRPCGTKWHRSGAQVAPRWRQVAPSDAQVAPRAPRWRPSGAQSAQGAPKWRPRGAKGRPSGAQVAPSGAHVALKWRPSGAQVAPKCLPRDFKDFGVFLQTLFAGGPTPRGGPGCLTPQTYSF